MGVGVVLGAFSPHRLKKIFFCILKIYIQNYREIIAAFKGQERALSVDDLRRRLNLERRACVHHLHGRLAWGAF